MSELMTRQQGAAQVLQSLTPEMPEGIAGFSPRQLGLQPLEMKIIHAIKGANEQGRPGQIRFGSEIVDAAEVVFLKAHPFRTLLEGPDKDRPKTTCASLDCKYPLDEVNAPKAATCAECAYGQWDTSPTGKRVPPACAESIAFLGLRLDAQDLKPFWFLCRKTAQRVAKDFLTDIIHDNAIRALHQCRVKVTTKYNKEGGLIWYTPVFTIERPLLPTQQYGEMAAAIMDVWYTPRVDQSAPPMQAEDIQAEAQDITPPVVAGADTWETLV